MSWFLFISDSGHDAKGAPLEVRGGCAVHGSRLWGLSQEIRRMEKKAFGRWLSELDEEFGVQIQGGNLLDTTRFEWVEWDEQPLTEHSRHRDVEGFLAASSRGKEPSREGRIALGQASLEMADHIFRLLQKHQAVVFASMIPSGIRPPREHRRQERLRNDHILLLDRFFRFLEMNDEDGVLVVDGRQKERYREFAESLCEHGTKSCSGRDKLERIFSGILYADSNLSSIVMAADLVAYAVNWGIPLPAAELCGQRRNEINLRYQEILDDLQFKGREHEQLMAEKSSRGICFLPDPYGEPPPSPKRVDLVYP